MRILLKLQIQITDTQHTKMKIYTKTGDNGTTGLFGGSRLSKDDIRIESYGTVDELNSQLGYLVSQLKNEGLVEQINQVQNLLFVIGSHLATEDPSGMSLPSLSAEHIEYLERAIDKMETELNPLKSFILPGGSMAGSICHISRTICRRAERRCVTLSNIAEIDPLIIPYINRLSDYLFVAARYINHLEGTVETPWIPAT